MDGNTQKISFEFYSQNEFNSALDTLRLIGKELAAIGKLKTILVQKYGQKYQYVSMEIKVIYGKCKRQVSESFENDEKLVAISESTDHLNKFNNIEEKELKKLDLEIKKKYGL